MKIWTQQDIGLWEELKRNGIVYCTKDSWLYKNCDFAYDWLAQQMCARLSPPPMPTIKLPLWGWVQYRSYKNRKPKFTPEIDNDVYSPQVFIEAEIPAELLLQSNFELWTICCLNGLEIGKELDDEVDMCNNQGLTFDAYPDNLKRRIMKSWECIFDLNYRNRIYQPYARRNLSIQATFWLLRKEWIKDVRFFIPK